MNKKQFLSLCFTKRLGKIALLTFSVALLLTLANASVTSAATNLVPNPTFSQTDTATKLPVGWTKGGWGTNRAVLTYPVTGRTDGFAVKTQITTYTNGDAKWYFTSVPVTPGTYLFSDYYQSNIPTILAAQFTDSTGDHYIPLTTFAASTLWKNAKWYFTVPNGVTRITIFHLISAVGWVTIDDLSLTSYVGAIPQPPIPTSANMILNPSLEYADLNGNAIGWLKGGWGTNTATLSIVHPGSTGAGNNATQVIITRYTNGDAKWYFTPVPVKPNYKYTITDYYRSSITSYTAVEFQMKDGTTQFYDLTTLRPSTGWKKFTNTFSTPANAKSLTFYHLIKNVGTLSTDNFGLAEGSASQLTKGIVSLNFDDGFLSAYTNATPILTSAGLKATYYIIQDETTAGDPSYMTLAQVKTLYAAGNEIGSHSKTHDDMTTMPAILLATQTTGTKTWFTNNGMPKVTTFAYPYGAYDDTVETAVKNAGFVAARSAFGGFNDKGTNKYEFKTFIVQNTTTAADIQAQIDYATQNKMWLILLFHEVITNTTGNQYSNTPAIIQSTANYLKSKSISVMTNDQVLPLLAQ